MVNEKTKKILFDSYYNLKSPVAFSTSRRISNYIKQKDIKIKKSEIDTWLSTQQTHTLHKDRRLKFSRCQYNINNIDDLWEIDLIDMQHISRKNSGFKYILAVIDCFSKFAWCIPIKRKTPTEVITAVKKLFLSTKRRPVCIQSDKGREFDNKAFKSYLAHSDIIYKTTKDPVTKAAICERFIRTIKSIIYKYFTISDSNKYVDVLDSILHIYNTRTHSTIGLAPCDVNEKDVLNIWLFTQRKRCVNKNIKHKCRVGDLVRVSNPKKVFDKGYKQKWSLETFTVKKCIMKEPPVYRLQDSDNVMIKGDFYENEIQKTAL